MKLVYGVGLNDEAGFENVRVDGVQVRTEFYEKWVGMLKRCYTASCHERSKSYIGCSVCDEWLKFSNFKAWMQQQDWHGKELDKDIIVLGNKVYSPETCAFVNRMTNAFVVGDHVKNKESSIGVRKNKSGKTYTAFCRNPFTRKREKIGVFMSEDEAYTAWKKKKHEHACRIAFLESDARVSSALRTRYL